MSEPSRIAVVGAGIIGTCIAERLQSQGKQVLLIDRQGPGEGCSKGNAGHFASDIVLPLASFATLLKVPRLLMDPLGPLTIRWRYLPQLMPWLMRFAWSAMPHNSHATTEALKSLNRPSISRYKRLLARTGLDQFLTQRGALTVYQTAKAQVANEKYRALVASHGVKVEHLNGSQIRELEPGLADTILGGLYFPDTAHSIDPHALVVALADSFRSRGGEFLKQELKDFKVNDDGKVMLLFSDQQETVDEVIIACGAWSKPWAEKAGHKAPLESERGYHLMLPDPGANLSRPVTSFEKSFVLTPMAAGLRLAGTVELAGLDAKPDYQRANILYSHARQILPGVQETGASHWMGHRPSLPDSLPVIGRSSKIPQILFAFGHQHLGLTQAAVTADLVADIVNLQANDSQLQAFAIERF